MDDSFDASLDFTLGEEGGFIDHMTDPRFATNHGITLARLRRFRRDPALARDDIRHMPCATVRAIYMADFWNRTRCDALPPGIDMAQWALAWCLQHDAMTCVIPGCKNVEQLNSNAAAAELARDDHPQAWTAKGSGR